MHVGFVRMALVVALFLVQMGLLLRPLWANSASLPDPVGPLGRVVGSRFSIQLHVSSTLTLMMALAQRQISPRYQPALLSGSSFSECGVLQQK
jgi:hypothetical protein